jgi:peptidoglycan/LPS O-acetylase OafA/YrhL
VEIAEAGVKMVKGKIEEAYQNSTRQSGLNYIKIGIVIVCLAAFSYGFYFGVINEMVIWKKSIADAFKDSWQNWIIMSASIALIPAVFHILNLKLPQKPLEPSEIPLAEGKKWSREIDDEEAVLEKLILETIEKEQPKNVEVLANVVCKQSIAFSKAAVIKMVQKLVEKGKIDLIEGDVPKKGQRLLITISLTVITNLLVFSISEQSVLLPLRWVTGYLFCFFVPGYAAINLLFPKKGLTVVEKLILSIAVSLAIIPLVGLFVNFVIGSLALPFIMTSLSVLVLALTIADYLKNG